MKKRKCHKMNLCTQILKVVNTPEDTAKNVITLLPNATETEPAMLTIACLFVPIIASIWSKQKAGG